MPCPATAEERLQDTTDQGGDCTEIYRWKAILDALEGHVWGLPFRSFDLSEADELWLIADPSDLRSLHAQEMLVLSAQMAGNLRSPHAWPSVRTCHLLTSTV